MHEHTRTIAITNVAIALAGRGWETYDVQPTRTFGAHPCFAFKHAVWSQVATHPSYPCMVVGVEVFRTDVSGIPYVPQERFYLSEGIAPGAPCTVCAGTGGYAGGLTYEEALASPGQQHTRLDAIARGERDHVSFFGNMPLIRDHYFEDGRPRCIHCHGRRHGWRYAATKPAAFPQFQTTPERKFWHLERDGHILATGVGVTKCADWSTGRHAATTVVDAIEQAARAA